MVNAESKLGTLNATNIAKKMAVNTKDVVNPTKIYSGKCHCEKED